MLFFLIIFFPILFFNFALCSFYDDSFLSGSTVLLSFFLLILGLGRFFQDELLSRYEFLVDEISFIYSKIELRLRVMRFFFVQAFLVFFNKMILFVFFLIFSLLNFFVVRFFFLSNFYIFLVHYYLNLVISLECSVSRENVSSLMSSSIDIPR